MPHCATSRCCHASRSDVFAPAHLGELTGVVPPEMVDAALEAGGGRERRLRRLPSRVIVYLLLAGALFVGHGWSYVFSRLTAKDDGRVRTPARSALSGAMRPVGPRPLRELFHLLAGPGTAGTGRRTRFAGRLVVALDGTRAPIADTERNRMVFPEPRGGPNGQAGYPMVRLVALIATGTRSMIDAVFGTDRVGELSCADTLLGALRSPMLLLADRNFAAHRIFDRVAAAGADFLIRARTGRRAMKLAPVERLPDGSWLARVRGRLVRVVDATIRVTTRTSTSTSEYRLITTLLDPATAPAERLVGLYHDRWEIETAYCELKSTILDATAGRARHPSGVEQELWALLATYQVLRIAMCDAILHRPDIAPDRLSFTTALRTARDQIDLAAAAIARTTVDLIGQIGTALLADLLPERRIRTRPRVIKRAISKHRAKSRDVDRRTYPATLRTQIHPPPPSP